LLAPASRERLGDARKQEAAGHSPAAFLFGIVLVFFAAAASYAALNKGPWLDEFWSYYLTDPSLTWSNLLRDRWLRDTHPVPANMLYLIVRGLGAEDPGPARLLLNLPALAVMSAAAILFFRTAKRGRSFYLLFPALVLALPDATLFASEFRSYFWQIALIVMAVQHVHLSLSEAEEVAGRRIVQLVGLCAVLLSLLLHFITSALVTPLYLLAALALWRDGRRAAAKRLGIALTLAWAILGPLALIHYGSGANDLDVRWITTNTAQALWMFAESLIAVAKGAAVPIGLLAFLTFRAPLGRDNQSARSSNSMPTSFAVLILRAILIGAIGLLVLNALQPILVSRYFLPWQVMTAGAVAALASSALDRRPVLLAATGIWSLAVIGSEAVEQAGQRRWLEGLERASAIAAACPGTRVYATSHWRFTQHRASRTAERESRIVELAYRRLAARRGLSVEVLDQRSPVTIAPQPSCPTLIWVQHFTAVPGTSAPDLLAGADITLTEPTAVRIVPSSEDSMLILIGPAD
jgi:hypothetical protein